MNNWIETVKSILKELKIHPEDPNFTSEIATCMLQRTSPELTKLRLQKRKKLVNQLIRSKSLRRYRHKTQETSS